MIRFAGGIFVVNLSLVAAALRALTWCEFAHTTAVQ
jgi:hypothetical protein